MREPDAVSPRGVVAPAVAQVGDTVIVEAVTGTPALRLAVVRRVGKFRLNVGGCYYRTGTPAGRPPAGGHRTRLVDPTPERLGLLLAALRRGDPGVTASLAVVCELLKQVGTV